MILQNYKLSQFRKFRTNQHLYQLESICRHERPRRKRRPLQAALERLREVFGEPQVPEIPGMTKYANIQAAVGLVERLMHLLVLYATGRDW